MRHKLLMLALSFTLMMLSASIAPLESFGRVSDEQKYVGTWAGAYTTEGGVTGDLSFTFSLDEKGQLRGSVKFTNQDGEQKADLKSIQLTEGKLNAKIESPDGQAGVTIEAKLQGDHLEGTYAVSPLGSTEIVEKGTWKVTKKAPAK